MMWIILDVIVVAVMAYFIWSSAKKGFAKTVLELVAIFVAYFLASTFSGMIAGWVYDTYVGDSLVVSIETELNNAADATITEVIPDYLVSGAQSLGIYDDIINSQKETARETALLLGENVAKPVVTTLVRLISAAVIFIVSMFILKLIIRAVNKIFKLPLIRSVNSFLGGLLGIVKGSAAILLLCVVVSLISMFTEGGFLIFTPEYIDQTLLFKHIYNFNPFI